MIRTARRRAALIAACLIAALAGLAAMQAPSIAAGALLFPVRTTPPSQPPAGCEAVGFAGDGVDLEGWRCRAAGARIGTIVYLHGIADNRSSAIGVARRFTAKGFDVVAYDSRAHGASGGDVCTYGFYEKRDLQRVIDAIAAGPIVVIGASLGGAVALQAAAEDPRITRVVAIEVFSDLRTIARERAPFFLTDSIIDSAFAVAEARGRFRIEDVSPLKAGPRIHVPVLLIHGAMDDATPPAHSQRVFAALAGPKRLILVEGARHNQSLGQPSVWDDLERWVLTPQFTRVVNPTAR